MIVHVSDSTFINGAVYARQNLDLPENMPVTNYIALHTPMWDMYATNVFRVNQLLSTQDIEDFTTEHLAAIVTRYDGTSWTNPFYEHEITNTSQPSQEVEPPTPTPPSPLENTIDVFYGGSMPTVKPKKRKLPVSEYHNKVIADLLGKEPDSVKGLIGLEIECEGNNLFNSPLRYWVTHSDDSLRCNRCKKSRSNCGCGSHAQLPVEYVLRQPLSYDDTVKALNYLDNNLIKSKSAVQYSSRTGVHVHINVLDLTIKELYNFILLYIIFEEMLVEFSGPERVGNLFCLRAIDSDFYVNLLQGVASGNSEIHDWIQDYRYTSCNISSVPKFGSLEFRSLKGTVDTNLILYWIRLLLHLKKVSQSFSNPISIVEKFQKTDPLSFYNYVFEETEFENLFKNDPGLSSKMWTGIRVIRDIAYANDWKKETKKKIVSKANNSVWGVIND
jgi:hypothetical protein